jgi:hypothetical protein
VARPQFPLRGRTSSQHTSVASERVGAIKSGEGPAPRELTDTNEIAPRAMKCARGGGRRAVSCGVDGMVADEEMPAQGSRGSSAARPGRC